MVKTLPALPTFPSSVPNTDVRQLTATYNNSSRVVTSSSDFYVHALEHMPYRDMCIYVIKNKTNLLTS